MTTIVITGSGKGIGYECAKQLSTSSENRVFCVSRNVDSLRHIQGDIMIVKCDLTDERSVNAASELIRSQTDKVDVLINNAGLLFNKRFEELTTAEWTAIYATNVIGLAALTRELLPLLSAGKLSERVRAHVVNISSMGGMQGTAKFAGLSAYSSSKGALAVLSECLAEEFRDRSVSVNCLAIGSADTEMFRAAFPGVKAGLSASEMASFVCDFSLRGAEYFNGKVLPVSASVP